MDAHPSSIDPDALLAEAGFLHALARELAHDAHAADDLVQETLLTALERPPLRDEGPRGLRAWLATVLRNRAWQHQRGDGRRRRREERVARAEALETDAGDVEARMLLQRRLADAITALPEPHRSAVTLHWLDGRSPREVARVQGISHDAARQRLSRATVLLRKHLDQLYGERTQWSVIALALPAPVPGPTLAAAKGVSLSITTKVAGASVFVFLLVVLTLRPWDRGEAGAGVTAERAQPAGAIGRADLSSTVPAESTNGAGARDSARVAADSVPRQPAAAPIDRERDLHGLVLDLAGRPVAGALLEVKRRESNGYADLALAPPIRPEPAVFVAKTTSADDGTFSVPLPAGRPHTLDVRATGFAITHFGNRYAGERVVVRLARGASIQGVVTRKKDGSPVEGALLRGFARDPRDRLHDPDEPFLVETDALGRYRADGIPAGPYSIIVVPCEDPAPPLSTVDLVDGASTQLDIGLETGKTLRGRVTDAETGTGIADVLLGEGWMMYRHVRTDRNGEYEIKGFPLEKGHELGALADGYGFRTVTVPPIETAAPQTLDVQLARGRVVKGRMVARDGRAIDGVVVAAVASGDGKNRGGLDWRRALSGTSGTFEISGLRLDLPHVILARKEGFGTVVYQLPKTERETSVIELGDIVLDPMAFVSGVVVDGTGKPLPDRHVRLRGTNSDRDTRYGSTGSPPRTAEWPIDMYVSSRGARTDDLGRFAFADVAPGEFRVRASLEGVRNPVESAVHVTAGALMTDVTLVLDEGLSIEGRVFGPDGNPVEKVSVRASGLARGRAIDSHAQSDPQGSFRLIGLAEGAYRLHVFCWDEHSNTRFAPAELSGVMAGSRDVVVRLRSVSRIEGFVLEADGSPVPFATVIARVGGPGAPPIAERADENGRYFIDVAEGDVADLEAQRSKDDKLSPGTVRKPSLPRIGVAAGTKDVELRMPPR